MQKEKENDNISVTKKFYFFVTFYFFIFFMEASLIIAQMLSICYLSIGIGFLVSREYYKKEIVKLPESSGFVLLSGYFAIILGMTILYIQSAWGNSEWATILTII